MQTESSRGQERADDAERELGDWAPARAGIVGHEGAKYLRVVRSAEYPDLFTRTDVYGVLVAFGVTCPATAHAVKKLLCAGQRGKGDRLADLKGAAAAVSRAIELEERKG